MKTLLAAAAFAVIAFGANGAANATAVSGVHTAKSATVVHKATFIKHHRKHRKCVVRHGHRRCWWR